MKIQVNKKSYKKIALILSLVVMVVWAILGTGASLAWFVDSTPEINNIFHFADFELEVSYRALDTDWAVIDGETPIFDDQALYEPGYTQVVYLKVENKGDRDFNFYTAVNVTGYTPATNVFGQRFNLQDYLKFGILSATTEEAMENALANRAAAARIATQKLNHYATESSLLKVGETAYIALVVRMPEEVGNVANYRGDTVPRVELGVIVKADQVQE